jgi:hypothetical protein
VFVARLKNYGRKELLVLVMLSFFLFPVVVGWIEESPEKKKGLRTSGNKEATVNKFEYCAAPYCDSVKGRKMLR